MSEKLYNVGMYIRLSRENTAYSGEDSMSIENQQAMLSKFVSMMPGWVEREPTLTTARAAVISTARAFKT